MSHPQPEHPTDLSCELIAWEVFEAYAKKVIRNYSRNLHRDFFRRHKREYMESLTDQSLPVADQYSWNQHSIVIDNRVYHIQSDALYDGLMRLPQHKREGLILHYWELQTDEELGERFGVTSRTIRRWRRQSLEDIQQCIGGEYDA